MFLLRLFCVVSTIYQNNAYTISCRYLVNINLTHMRNSMNDDVLKVTQEMIGPIFLNVRYCHANKLTNHLVLMTQSL